LEGLGSCRKVGQKEGAPSVPFLAIPIPKDIWVEVGPGRHEPSASSSRKTVLLIHFSFVTKRCTQWHSTLGG
jgi:hypothetical protein